MAELGPNQRFKLDGATDMREDKAYSSPRIRQIELGRRKSVPNDDEDDADDEIHYPSHSHHQRRHHHKQHHINSSPVKEGKMRHNSPKARRRRRDRTDNDDNDNDVATKSPTISTSITAAIEAGDDLQDSHASSFSEEQHNRVHSPLHHFVHPPSSPPGNGDNKSLRESLREGKRQLLHILNSPEGTAYSNFNNRNTNNHHHQQQQQQQLGQIKVFNKNSDGSLIATETEDGSTASTSGSNSSSSSAFEGNPPRTPPKKHVLELTPPFTPMTPAMDTTEIDSDQELEICSRQIRLELRRAEMLELANEAERAAASGQKRFAGRASTFGFGDEMDLEYASGSPDDRSRRASFSSQRKLRRSMDFGTPLGRRLGRRQTPSKISVVALRDVAEVVPSFKDFHLHLRTHFVRRRVDENVLLFSEVNEATEGQPNSPIKQPPGSVAENREDNNMMHLWPTFNFGSWTSAGGKMEHNTGHNESATVNRDPPAGTVEDANKDDDDDGNQFTRDDAAGSGSTTAEIDVGFMLSGHTHSPIQGSRVGLTRYRVEIPPGLSLLDHEAFTLRAEQSGRQRTGAQANPTRIAAVKSIPRTPEQKKGYAIDLIESPSDERIFIQRQPIGTSNSSFQDGSPHSPIIIDDIGLGGESSAHDQGRVYRPSSPPPNLPLTPKDNFHRVFESKFTTPKESRFQELMATKIEAASAGSVHTGIVVLGPDFVTPVRLRDIRDDKTLASDFVSRLPQAPLMGGYGYEKNSLLADTPTKIGTPNNDENRRSLAGGSMPPGGIRLARRSSPRITHEYGALLHSSFDDTGDRAVALPLSKALETTPERGNEKPAEHPFGKQFFSDEDANNILSLRASQSGHFRSTTSSGINERRLDDRFQNQDLLQSASMPANPSEHSSASSLKDSIIAKGRSYDGQQTVGESTMERAKHVAIRHRAHSYGGAKPPASTSPSPQLHRIEGSKRPQSDSNLGKIVESRKVESVSKTSSARQSESPNEDSILVIDFNGMDTTEMHEGSVAGDSRRAGSKATADFQCECLISPASSLDSGDGIRDKDSKPRSTTDFSTWNLMEHSSMPLFSSISPSDSHRMLENSVAYAPSKENDAFVSNYLYCGKTPEVEVAPDPEPMCAGNAAMPCQDAMPCGQIAVDSCMGNFLDNTLKFLPRKQAEGNKLLSLSRDNPKCPPGKSTSWYDLANEKFDRLLDNIMGNEHRNGDNRLSYEAPALKERKSPERPLPKTPPRHNEVYDEDFGGVVYVRSSDLSESSSRQSHVSNPNHPTRHEKHTTKTKAKGRKKAKSRQPAKGDRQQQTQLTSETLDYGGYSEGRRLLVSQHTM